MQNDPLQQLKDVHPPADPSWWPPAIGWWLLALISIACLTWLALIAWRAWRARRPIRAAHAEIKQLFAAQPAPLVYATEANAILKRLLVHALGRRHYAPMVGEAWLYALDNESNSTNFSGGPGQVLGNVRFSPQVDVDRDALHEAVRDLLNSVKVAA